MYLYLLRRHHHSGTSSPGLTSGPSPPHQVLILKICYPLFILFIQLFINHYSLFIIHHPLPSSLKAWTTRPPRLQHLVSAAWKRICSERSGSTASPIYPGEEDLGNVQKSKEVIIANPSKSSSAKRLKYWSSKWCVRCNNKIIAIYLNSVFSFQEVFLRSRSLSSNHLIVVLRWNRRGSSKKRNMCVHNDNDMQPRVRVIVKLNINPSARNLSLLILSTRIRCNQNISPLRLFYTQDCPFHLKWWEESWRFLLNLIYFLGIHSRMTLFLMKLFSAKMVVTYQFFLESIAITNKFLRRCWSCIFEESWSIWHCNRNNGRSTTSRVPRRKHPFCHFSFSHVPQLTFGWVGFWLGWAIWLTPS